MRHYKEKLIAALLLTSVGVSACAGTDIKGEDAKAIGSQATTLDNNASSSSETGDNSQGSESVGVDNSTDNTSKDNEEGDSTVSGNTAGQSSDLYESFLNGSGKATLSDDFFDGSVLLIAPNDPLDSNYSQTCNLDRVNGFTIDDLKLVIGEAGYESITKPAYAYVDFGNDGNSELIVKFEAGSGYAGYFVFSDAKGSVELTYAGDQGERWSFEIYDNGFISSYGSSGAGAHSGCMGGLDSQGVYHNFISEYEVYYGWEIYGDYSREEDFNEVIKTWAEENDSRQGEIICYSAVAIGGAEYYCYYNMDETGAITEDDINELVTMCASKNIDIIDYSQIEAKVLEYQKSIGMDNVTYDSGNDIDFKSI